MGRVALRLWHEVLCARQRAPFQHPDLGLVTEWQRFVSYLAVVVVTFELSLSPMRTVVAAALALLGAGYAFIGIVLGGRRPQCPGALLDLLLVPWIAAAGTGSPFLVACASAFVLVLVFLSFQIDARVPFALAALSWTVGLTGRGAVPSLVSATVVLIVVMCSIAVVVVGVLAIRSRLARRSLSRRDAHLTALLDSAPVFLCSIGPDGKIGSAGGVLPAPEWAEGAHIDAVLPPGARELVDLALAGRRVSGDVEIGRRCFDVTCVPFEGGVLVTGLDVTERESARADLEHLLSTKDEFVASISHELRTPLTAILGFAEEMRRISPLPRNAEMFAGLIAAQSADMAAIIEDLLVAARADLGIVNVVLEPVDLRQEARVVAASLADRVASDVVVRGGPTPAMADPIRVRQVIRNLLTNADRYGRGPYELWCGIDGHWAVVEMRDSGPPIPAARRESMFLPYESHGGVPGRTSAIGLGLSVSRKLAQLMGGNLTYRHDGEWSTFRLSAPAARLGVDRGAPVRVHLDASPVEFEVNEC
jgi:signal transduction histidine kinase